MALLFLTVTAAGVAAAADREPIREPVVCALAIESPPPVPGELPVLEDPVSSTADALGCEPDIDPTSMRTLADAKAVLGRVQTDISFTTDANNVVQVAINTYAAATNVQRDRASQATVLYRITVTPPNPPGGQPKTRDVTVTVNLLQGDGRVGGNNLSTFAIGDIPAGATAKVDIVSGTVNVEIGRNPGLTVPSTLDPGPAGTKVR